MKISEEYSLVFRSLEKTGVKLEKHSMKNSKVFYEKLKPLRINSNENSRMIPMNFREYQMKLEDLGGRFAK
jgi:hypothetical protein